MSSSGKTVSDYPDAVDRIVDAHVRADSTTQAEIARDLARGGPQVTAGAAEEKVLDDIADSIVSEERVIEAIESSGEIPSEREIDAITDASDDYDMSDRQSSVADAIRDRVATSEDIDSAVESKRPSDRPMFREDVADGVSDVGSEKEIRGASVDDVVESEAVERGAPSETAYRGASARATSPDSAVSPSDLGVGSQTTDVNVIEDSSGEPLVAFGGSGQIDGRPAGEVVADELGAEYAGTGTDALESIQNDFSTAGTGSSVDLTFRGRKVGEVDV
jgi:hypothetical protein